MGNFGHHPEMNSMFEKQMLSAIIFASALLMLSSIVLLIPISSPADFLPEQFKAMHMQNSAPQRMAHAVWVLLIALICVFILIRPRGAKGNGTASHYSGVTLHWLSSWSLVFFCTGPPRRRHLSFSTTIIMASSMDQHCAWFLDTTPLICG